VKPTIGCAPVFGEPALDDPALEAARIAVDRHWRLVAANAAVGPMLAGVADALLQPPINVLRVALHPEGLAGQTLNLAEWRAHLLTRLRRQIELTADSGLIGLFAELEQYPAPGDGKPPSPPPDLEVAVPLQLRTEAGVVWLISTITVFGTPIDVTLAELALECFYPAGTVTRDILQSTANRRSDRL
jgi:hypothetical protein